MSPEPMSPSEELRSLRLRDIQRQIQRYYREIQGEIDAIGDTVASTLKRQEEEYLTAFQLQLGKVTEEVKRVRMEMERQAEAVNIDTQLQRLRQVTKELDSEANRLAARVERSKEQTTHWKFRSQELEAETHYLIKQNHLLRRRLKAAKPEKRLSNDFSPPLNTSTKASNTPCMRSGDYEAHGYVAALLNELERKYAISEPEFARDMNEVIYLLQRPLNETIRHLRQILENTQRQMRRLMQEQGTDALLPTEISHVLSPRKTPLLSSFRASLTPSTQRHLLSFESSTISPQGSKARTPTSCLRRRAVVTNGKLLLGP